MGFQFLKIHNFTEDFYDKLFEDLDEVAELLKMKGKMPLPTMAEYLETSTIKESLEIIKEDMETMRDLGVKKTNMIIIISYIFSIYNYIITK